MSFRVIDPYWPNGITPNTDVFNITTDYINNEGGFVVIDGATGLLYGSDPLWDSVGIALNQNVINTLRPLVNSNGVQIRWNGAASTLRLIDGGLIPYQGDAWTKRGTEDYFIDPAFPGYYLDMVRSIDASGAGYIGSGAAVANIIISRLVRGAQAAHASSGSGDFITGFLDAGGGVAIFMAAVGALAISGAGIGLANTVTEAVATGTVGEGVVTTGVVASGEAAAQTVVAVQYSTMTAAEITAELNALTMSTALDAAAVNAAAQAGIITAAEQATLLQTVAQGAIDLSSTVGRNIVQKAIEETIKPPPSTPTEPPPVNTPMTAAEQAAKLLKDQAIKLATGAGGSAVIKALTGGTTTPNRNTPAYLQRPQDLTNTDQSGSVLPIALIVAALTLLG